jgi:hypothetical protein
MQLESVISNGTLFFDGVPKRTRQIEKAAKMPFGASQGKLYRTSFLNGTYGTQTSNSQ